MKNITTNELQDQLSKIIKEVEAGEIYSVSRYSKPVAFLISKDEFGKKECKACMEDLRKIANKIRK